MVFVPFTGVDNHWKNVTFAGGLLAKEKYKYFAWLIMTLKKAMGRVPSCVITDQCPTIKKALKLHWPETKHRLCLWHIMNKLPSKIGPILSFDKKFMGKLKSVVYSDHSTPFEFEEGWNDVIAEYNLDSNVWLTSMFNKLRQSIPAYFSDIEMAGLLRTTSRSESSNFFFHHFHDSGDTLVEFYSNFESALDKQRLRSVDDDTKSRNTPQTATTMSIELDASHIYTLELYCMIREEIKSACYHTRMTDMPSDDETQHFTCHDELFNEKEFEVSVRHSDNHVTCSCKLYFQRGYLCMHAFAALKQCGVHRIPRQFVNPRWTKDAIKFHSTFGSSEPLVILDKCDRTKVKRARAWFEFNNYLDTAGDDEEKVDIIMNGLQKVKDRLQNKGEEIVTHVQAHRADRFIGPIPENEEDIHNPLINRSKGCGTRIKSSKEISIKAKKNRMCSIFNKTEGHNARTCPLNK